MGSDVAGGDGIYAFPLNDPGWQDTFSSVQPVGKLASIESNLATLGEQIAAFRIKPIGTPSGDWRRSAAADGWLIVRHPELQTTLQLAERVARELRIYAG